jgi:uncharacterized membrane protein YbhN (UPF0104 family)
MPRNPGIERFLKPVTDVLIKAAGARSQSRSRNLERALTLFAFVVFVVGLYLGIKGLPDSVDAPNWTLLATVALAGVPLTVATNVGEYLVSARLLGFQPPIESAVRVSVLASAANLLPIPGSVLVRTQAMRGMGAKTGKALGASALVGVVWVAVGAALTGAFLLIAGRMALGLASALGGAVITAVALYLAGRLEKTPSNGLSATLVLVEIASILVKGGRLFVVLHALHYAVDLDQAMALCMAAVISTASGFFPGGLGATEALSAAVGPLVGLPAAVALVAAAVDRIIGLAVLAVLAGVLLLRKPEAVREVAEAEEQTGGVAGDLEPLP